MFQALISRIDDRLNPIVVKELRQSTNSSLTTVAVLLFLAAQLFIMFIELFFNDAEDLFSQKQTLFPWFMAILVMACVFLVIPSSGWRFSNERNSDTRDLIYTTILSPFAIVNGKTFSNLIMLTQLYSLCAPFIFISYLFPGVDLITIILALLYSFMFVITMSQFMIMLSSLQNSKISQSGGMLFYIIVSIILFSNLVAVQLNRPMTGIPFYGHLIIILFWVLSLGVLYMASVCIISQPNSNRALGLRLYLAGYWAIALPLLIIISLAGGFDLKDAIEVWLVAATILFIISIISATGERTEYSARLRRRLPQRRFYRFLCFPFFSGAVNGIVYGMIFVILSVLIAFIGGRAILGKPDNDFWDLLAGTLGAAGYFIWYSLLALKIKQWLNRFRNINAFMIFPFIFIVTTIMPILIGMAAYPGRCFTGEKLAPFMIFSCISVFFDGFQRVGLIFGWGLAVILMLLNHELIRKAITDFVPADANTATESTPMEFAADE